MKRYWVANGVLTPSECGNLVCLDEVQDAVEALQRERDELQSVFDLGHTRTVEADKLWQEAHGQPEVWPDLGELVGWLMKRHDDVRAELEALRDEREKAKGLQSTEEVT